MKIRALLFIPLCCEKAKDTVEGIRGDQSRRAEFNADSIDVTWIVKGKGGPWDALEITYCPHCAARLPNEIPDIEVQ